jgi:hypothetical protein
MDVGDLTLEFIRKTHLPSLLYYTVAEVSF